MHSLRGFPQPSSGRGSYSRVNWRLPRPPRSPEEKCTSTCDFFEARRVGMRSRLFGHGSWRVRVARIRRERKNFFVWYLRSWFVLKSSGLLECEILADFVSIPSSLFGSSVIFENDVGTRLPYLHLVFDK